MEDYYRFNPCVYASHRCKPQSNDVNHHQRAPLGQQSDYGSHYSLGGLPPLFEH